MLADQHRVEAIALGEPQLLDRFHEGSIPVAVLDLIAIRQTGFHPTVLALNPNPEEFFTTKDTKVSEMKAQGVLVEVFSTL
jgi:hypothetical protein